MKSQHLYILILYFGFISFIQSQTCYKAAWVKDFGGNSAYQGVVDGDRRPDGKFVIAGSFSNAPLTLGTFTIPNLYAYNYYLAIHDSSGVFYAASLIASGGTISKIDVGNDGSVYVTGYWDGSIIVGNDTLPSASRKRVYVAKFDAGLQFKWLQKSSWMSADCYSYDVTSDLQKNVYICGTFEDDAFRIGDSVATNAGGWNLWSNDAFLAKFDSNGTVKYLRSFGGVNDEVARTITADSLGNVFVTGNTVKTVGVINFGKNVALPGSVADNSGYLAKLDGTTGKFLWARMLGGLNTYDTWYPYDACLGDNNSLIVSGSITGTITCPPNTFIASDQNGFVARFNTDGANEWLQQTGGQNGSEYGYYCFYNKGKIAVSGRLFSNQTYCADFPLYSTMSNSTFSAYNAMFESNGKLIWARGNDISTYSDYYPEVVFVDDSGNQLYWGAYKNTQTWYPITKTNALANHKTFLARFIPFSYSAAFTVSAGPDKSTSCGTNVQLNASTTPSTIPWGWWPSLGFSSNGSKTPYVSPGKPSYYVFYATYQGCVKSDTVFVDVTNYNSFYINAGTDKIICSGDSVQLNTGSNQSGLTYSWLPAKYINSATSQNPWVKPVFSTNYSVTASLGNCKAMDTVYVNQQWKPYIYLPKQDQYYAYGWRYHICEGNPVDINMGNPVNTYTVLTPSVCSSINNNLITLHGNLPGGQLVVEATSPVGCHAKDSVNVIIHNNQTAPVILGSVPDRTACTGDSIQMVIWLTNSLLYNFQYSWYGGWQIDSMNGGGWKDISYWEKYYESTLFSSGYPTSTYYTRLRIPLITADMDGFRFRCKVQDYCSPASYSNAGTLSIGPKLTTQPPAMKTICQNITDSISCNSTSLNTQYSWEIKQAGSWVPLQNQPGIVSASGRFLRIYTAQASFDSTWVRCGLSGCNASNPVYSNPSLIRVVPVPVVVWQTAYDTICPGLSDSLMVQANSSMFTYNWYANNVAITTNNSQINGYNTNKLRFTPVYSAQNAVDYKLKISNQQCAFTLYSDTTGFRVISVPAVSWPGNMIMTCVNAAPITLSGATPPGGTYSGPGVVGNTFNPSLAGLGGNTVTYTVNSATPGCTASAGKSFYVYDLPVVTWPGGDVQLCTTSNSYHLTGATPANGTYSGPGVSGAWFSPATAGVGTHTVTYSYLYPTTGCTNTITRTFIVGTGSVSWPGGTVNLCLSSSSYLLNGGNPAGGTYSGTGVSGNLFNPSVSGVGTFTVTYTVTGLCSGSSTRSFVVAADPVATWPGGQASYCIDDPADSLFGALPSGGIFTGPGALNGMFYPQQAGIGLHTIIYTYVDPLNNCQDQVSRPYFVDECTGIKTEPLGNVRILQYSGKAWLKFSASLAENTSITIMNPLGQAFFSGLIPAGTRQYILPFLSAHGPLNFIQLSNKSECRLIKFVHFSGN